MLFPHFRDVPVEQAYSSEHRTRRAERPWVVLSMISSADGATSLDGNSARLGGSADRQVFLHLHRSVDCVLVGAETVRRDSYSPLPAHQQLVVVSRTGDLGANTESLMNAGNTKIAAGDVHNIVRQLPGSVCALEGGPRLNGQMLRADLVDEVCLTIAPLFVGGPVGRIVEGDWVHRDHWNLAHVGQDSGFVFLRYLRSELGV